MPRVRCAAKGRADDQVVGALPQHLLRRDRAFSARGQKVDILPRTDVDAKKKTLDVTLDVEAAAQ